MSSTNIHLLAKLVVSQALPPIIQDCLFYLILSEISLNWWIGIIGMGSNFFKLFFSWLDSEDTLNDYQILKFVDSKFGMCRFATLTAALKPLEYYWK